MLFLGLILLEIVHQMLKRIHFVDNLILRVVEANLYLFELQDILKNSPGMLTHI